MSYLTVDDCEIHYEVRGEGPAVVLTQGGMSPLGAMLPLAIPLSERYRVILWDRANQGSSQVCFDESSEHDVNARHLRALLEHIGEERACLVGASEGVRVNMRTALRYPEVVVGLFMWEIAAGEAGVAPTRELFYEQYARIAETKGMDAVIRTPWWAERVKFNLTNRQRLLDIDPVLFASRMRDWAAELRGGDASWGHYDDEVKQVTCPAWIVEGVDAFHPPEKSQRLAQLMPEGRLVQPPYDGSAFDLIKEVDYGLQNPFVRYADVPGLLPLIEDFLAQVTAPGTTR